MFAYDYLKQNVKLNNDKFIYNWASLYLDKDVAFSVKQEIKELYKKDLPLKDSVLYWHKHLVLLPLLSEETSGKSEKLNYTEFLGSKFCDYMYSLITLEQCDVDRGKKFIKNLVSSKSYYIGDTSLITSLNALDISFTEYKQIFDAYNMYKHGAVYSTENGYMLICIGQTIINKQLYASSPYSTFMWTQIYKQIVTVLTYCTRNLINRLYELSVDDITTSIQNIQMLLEDCGDIEGLRFDSINEMQQRHDEQTAMVTKDLLAKAGNNKYKYHFELTQLLKDNSLYLPKAPVDFVLRGSQHHNCVANYTGKHTTNYIKDNVNKLKFFSRVFFTEAATCELELEVYDGLIISTRVAQYKGMFNKNLPLPTSLYVLRTQLVGKPAEIINVLEVDND